MAVVAELPSWSVMVPTYKPGPLLRQTLESVVNAKGFDDGRLQLEVVDDATPGDPVRGLLDGWGFSKIPVFRRPRNGGLAACWNTCIERASGELVHILHQDDFVAPTFYSEMTDAARRFPSAGMLFCRTTYVRDGSTYANEQDHVEPGIVSDWLRLICSEQRLQCPSVVVRASTYSAVGPFSADLKYVIDWEMWIRIAARFDVAHVPLALAMYRVHAGAESQRIKSGAGVTPDVLRGVRLISDLLDERGRRDCLDLVLQHAWVISGWAAWEAERARQPRVAAKELLASLLHLARGASTAEFVRRLIWLTRVSGRSLAARVS